MDTAQVMSAQVLKQGDFLTASILSENPQSCCNYNVKPTGLKMNIFQTSSYLFK